MSECLLGIAYKLNVPFLYVSTTNLMPYHADSLRIPLPTSHVPVLLLPFSDRMGFLERIVNTFMTQAYIVLRNHYFNRGGEIVMREYLRSDSSPSFREIEKNVSLILVNTHISVDYPRPLMPNVIEIGGLQCRKPRPLPKVSNRIL